jgi:uncharacterized SAM-binding protein YcdF (DUF218 family)
MKALAISLGVPGEAILLEDKASSTYENVKFTLDILNKKRWDKIIFLSHNSGEKSKLEYEYSVLFFAFSTYC